MKDLIKKYQELTLQASTLLREIETINDGFIYLLFEEEFGSTYVSMPNNEFTALKTINKYYGDNGIVDVYTNNKSFDTSKCAGVGVETFFETKEELKQLLLSSIHPLYKIPKYIREYLNISDQEMYKQ